MTDKSGARCTIMTIFLSGALIGSVKRTGNVDFIGTIEIILKGDWQKGFERMTLEGVIYDYDYSHHVTLDLGE